MLWYLKSHFDISTNLRKLRIPNVVWLSIFEADLLYLKFLVNKFYINQKTDFKPEMKRSMTDLHTLPVVTNSIWNCLCLTLRGLNAKLVQVHFGKLEKKMNISKKVDRIMAQDCKTSTCLALFLRP